MILARRCRRMKERERESNESRHSILPFELEPIVYACDDHKFIHSMFWVRNFVAHIFLFANRLMSFIYIQYIICFAFKKKKKKPFGIFLISPQWRPFSVHTFDHFSVRNCLCVRIRYWLTFNLYATKKVNMEMLLFCLEIILFIKYTLWTYTFTIRTQLT